MEEKYRETTNGRTVKYDSDPTNDYSDGYNAGRRYQSQEPKRPWWLLPLLLALLGLLLWFVFDKSNDASDKNPSAPATTSTVDPNRPTPESSASVVPGVIPNDHKPDDTPPVLPRVGPH